ncbi:MAG TPA: RNA polymerase sigma factor [Urbifossiella sp.]|nr:RNA polymerase sigma factor [Urbifossiella sp.]
MTGTRPAEILRQLAPDTTPDAELIERFLRRDENAFAVLVRRHGAMILSTCRRITQHAQDAEDAFQVVFLLLAKKASAIREPHLIGNWLYGAAVRVARQARRAANRRRAREIQAGDVPEPFRLPCEPVVEYGRVVHEELAKLPAHYREAIVLCELQGVSRAKAARALGIPEGTLSSRLAGGRKKLAGRLSRRGIALTAAAVPNALAEGAAIPDSLVTKTCGLVAGWQAGARVPVHLSRLLQGGLAMRKMMLLGAMSLAAATIGVVYAATSSDAPNPITPPPQRSERPTEKSVPTVAAAEQPKKEAVATSFGTPRLQRAFDVDLAAAWNVLWSPDGKQLAIEGSATGKDWQNSVVIYPVENRPAIDYSFPLEPRMRLVGFTPDGSQFIRELHEFDLVSGRHELSYRANQVLGDTLRAVMLDSERTVGHSFAPDGKTYRTVAREVRPGPKVPVAGERYHEIDTKIWVREVSTTTGRTLRTLLNLQGEFTSYMLSGDGKKLVVGEKDGIAIHDLSTHNKKFTPIAASPPLPRQGPMPFGPELTPPPNAFGEELQPALKMPARPINVAISPNGKVVFAFRDEDSPVLVDGETGKLLSKLEDAGRISSTFDIGAGNFSAESRLIAVVGFRWNKDVATHTSTQEHFLNVWDCRTGKLLKSWPTLVSVAFHPTKPILAILEPNDKKTRVGLWDFSAEMSEAAQAGKKAATPEELVALMEAAQKTDDPRAGLPLLGGPHRALNVQAVETLEAAKAFEKALDDKFGKDPSGRPLFPSEFEPVKRIELKGKKDLGGGKVELTLWTVRDAVLETREVAIRENGGWAFLAPVPFTHSTAMEEIRTVDGREVKVQVMSPHKELTPDELAAARSAVPRARILLERGAKDVAAGKHATRKAAVTAVETEVAAAFEPGQGKSAGKTNRK